MTVGSCPDSWGVWFPDDPDHQAPWSRFLDEVALAGYEWIELGPYGYLPTDLTRLRQELDTRGLRVSGTFLMAHFHDAGAWPLIEREAQATCETLARLEASFLILIDDVYNDLATGAPLRSPSLQADEWKRLVETTHRLGEIAAEHGLRAAFHPHAETHIEYEDQIERLLADLDPRVGLCLDVGHHAYRGGDPVAFYRKHHQRITYLHLKSVDRERQQTVEREKMPFAKAVEDGVFTEPAHGAVDFVALAAALSECNYQGFATVEQDMYPCPPDKPLPIAARTRAYLKGIGIG